MTQDWSAALRFHSTEKSEIANAKALRSSARDLRNNASKGQYSAVDVTEFWALIQAASPALRASSEELSNRAGLGNRFFTTVARERRNPKLENFLSALTAIIEVADERLYEVEHSTNEGDVKTQPELPPQVLQTYMLASLLANVARNELTALDEERPNDAETIERNRKLRELLSLFANGLERIASILQEVISKPRERRLLIKAKELVDDLGHEISKWVATNKGDLIDCGMRLQLIAGGIALLGSAGAEMTVATTVVAAMIGGPRVIDAIKRGSN